MSSAKETSEEDTKMDTETENIDKEEIKLNKEPPEAKIDTGGEEVSEEKSQTPDDPFKKPNLMGSLQPPKSKAKPKESDSNQSEAEKELRLKETASMPVPYEVPPWGKERPGHTYSFQVLKGGTIVGEVDLSENSSHVVGRLASCDVVAEHPSISRHHAIVQYRTKAGDKSDEEPGLYLYDLSSTHGTFLNKNQLFPRKYYRLRVGHMVKFGLSTRLYFLQGPPEDQEEESELSVSELRENNRAEKEKLRAQEVAEEEEKERERRRQEEAGINWGMGDDADESTDATENPYCNVDGIGGNEELYLDDPKKTLRGWFEREGYDLHYDVEERGYGQFLCKIELPVDSPTGKRVVAEVMLKGKKKEAVVQCALEACKILDQYGLLRQKNHESKKKKTRNWEEDDFYDSDEDTFLDRTGTIEKKRHQRMRAAGKDKEVTETYESLTNKHEDLTERLKNAEGLLNQALGQQKKDEENDEDELDAYMAKLESGMTDKKTIQKLKMEIAKLRKEEEQVRKLMNLAKPAKLPELKAPALKTEEKTEEKKSEKRFSKAFPATRKIPKREMRGPMPINLSVTDESSSKDNAAADIEEQDEEEEEEKKNMKKVEIPATNANLESSSKTSLNLTEKTEPGKQPVSEMKRKLPQVAKVPAVEKKKTKAEEKKTKSKPEKQYEYDVSNPDYSMWMPPEGQSGDGKTKLNEKYGY